MPRCTLCPNVQSKLNPGDICLTCKNKGFVPIDENATLGEIPFKAFKAWHIEELSKLVKSEIKIYEDKFNDDLKDVSERVAELETLKQENNTLKKVVAEQQKFLETLRRDQQCKNIFISSIPETLHLNGNELNTPEEKVTNILQLIDRSITKDDFKVLHSFPVFTTNDGDRRHSMKISFHNKEKKDTIMEKKVALKDLGDDDPLQKVYIKNDQPPLTNRENNRLRVKARRIRTENPEDTVKIDKVSPDNDNVLHLKILWWNLNGRTTHIIEKNLQLLLHYDLLCFTETHIALAYLPCIKNYRKIADPSVQFLNRGGTAIYVSDRLSKYVFDISYNDCYVSLRLTICPQFKFFTVYITCENSSYADINSFGQLSQQLIECASRRQVPIIGGDFNSRAGDLNEIKVKGMNWRYDKNCDDGTNLYGRTYFKDLCRSSKILPINHMVYKNRKFSGDFTYIKSQKKSQIDYCMTNGYGRKYITDFNILSHSWHLSDHRPLELGIKTPIIIDATNLLSRAIDLNRDATPNKVYRYNKEYNLNSIKAYLTSHSDEITYEVTNQLLDGNIDTAVDSFKDHIVAAHTQPQCKIAKQKKNVDSISIMNADKSFKQYLELQKNPNCNQQELDEAIEKYRRDRKKVSMVAIKDDINEWKNKTDDRNSRELWQKIDWKGKLTHQNPVNHPNIDEFKLYFEDLYKHGDLSQVINLTSQVYIPILDDEITPNEVQCVVKGMKKGGYDFSMAIVNILPIVFMQLLVMIFNHLFYLEYPHSYTHSLLFAIEKKGDLSKTSNYRGIQMMQAIACIYDRIIAGRLLLWLPISDEQTAYQKGKSTLLHVFTIRIIIELAKKLNLTIYLGFFDIQKAFDHVSRFKMLQKLVKLGIGSNMLNALKRMYVNTNCCISYLGDYSENFKTFSGIRQGASSSVLLFNAFMDDLIKHLQLNCPSEPMINDLHTLLHADDTILLSTSRQLFIDKCNKMINHFDDDELLLNMGKSGYMIINGKAEDLKVALELETGMLKYKAKQTYLGVLVTDTGNMKADVKMAIEYKRPSLTIKYNNFCHVNSQAPLSVKLKVLDSCVNSSLLYSCETWSNKCLKEMDMLHRRSLRTALSIRNSINNEIAYIETGRYPLKSEIEPRQLKFWKSITDIIDSNDNHYLAKLISLARQRSIQYITHYEHLTDTYIDSTSCKRLIQNEFFTKWTSTIDTLYNLDRNSKLGTYKAVNPHHTSHIEDYPIMEYERRLITRYRCGSHNLRIETGRWERLAREHRLCSCEEGVQTLYHILKECPTTEEFRLEGIDTLEDLFKLDQKIIVNYLQNITKALGIKI